MKTEKNYRLFLQYIALYFKEIIFKNQRGNYLSNILFTLCGTMTPSCDCNERSERGGQSKLSLASPLTYLTSYRKEISLKNQKNIFTK